MTGVYRICIGPSGPTLFVGLLKKPLGCRSITEAHNKSEELGEELGV